MPSKAQIKKMERERREAEWRAEQERVNALGALFSALPNCTATDALRLAMRDRIIELYDQHKFEEGDAILEFLPNRFARQLLDWYFPDEDTSQTTPAPTGQDENPQPGQIQGEPCGQIRSDGQHPF